MNRKLKALGLALFAVLAMGALSASAASAGEFHSESAETVLKGSQIGNDVFTTNAGTVTCNEATYAGVQSSATATTVKVTPTYTQCTAFGFVNATVDVNGSQYEFSADNNKVKIIQGTAPITVTAFNCWVTVGSQEAAEVKYTNAGSGASRDVRVDVNISTLTYTQHSKSFPGCTNGTFSNGKYVGAATVQGFTTGGAQVGIWKS